MQAAIMAVNGMVMQLIDANAESVLELICAMNKVLLLHRDHASTSANPAIIECYWSAAQAKHACFAIQCRFKQNNE